MLEGEEMKILHICAGWQHWNGAANIARMIMDEQRREGHEVSFATWAKIRDLKAADEVWIHCGWLPCLWWAAFWAKNARWMPEACYDPIRLKFSAWKKRLAGPIERWSLRRCKKLVATCDAEKAWIEAYLGKKCPEIVVEDIKRFFKLGVRGQGLGVRGGGSFELGEYGKNFRQRAQAKVDEWLKGISEDRFVAVLDELLDKKLAEGEYRFKGIGGREAIRFGAIRFFKEFSHRIVQLSDGRCVYFTPDERAKMRNVDNAVSWAEYAVHAVTNGGVRLPGKTYNERWLNYHKIEAFDILEPTLLLERCVVRRSDNARYDAIMFEGDNVLGRVVSVVTRLDDFGNIDANLTEVTFEASSKQKKVPRVMPLAEAVKTVVHRQVAAGSNPSTQESLSNSSESDKGEGLEVENNQKREAQNKKLNVLYLGRRHPLKGVKYLEFAVEELNYFCMSRVPGGEDGCIDLRIVSGAKGEELEKVWEWCDVLVLPTLSENFGIVVAEALERGKRVITTDGAPAWEELGVRVSAPCGCSQPIGTRASRATARPSQELGVSDQGVGVRGEELVYLKGFRDGSDEERIKLLKDALMMMV